MAGPIARMTLSRKECMPHAVAADPDCNTLWMVASGWSWRQIDEALLDERDGDARTSWLFANIWGSVLAPVFEKKLATFAQLCKGFLPERHAAHTYICCDTLEIMYQMVVHLGGFGSQESTQVTSEAQDGLCDMIARYGDRGETLPDFLERKFTQQDYKDRLRTFSVADGVSDNPWWGMQGKPTST
jgi:hypothetical protein